MINVIKPHYLPFIILILFFTLVSESFASNELALRNQIRQHSVQLFLSEDFKRLDSLAKHYRESQARTPSGIWKLTEFYKGLMGVLAYTEERTDANRHYEIVEGKIKKWIAQNPKSSTAHIMYAGLFIEVGWEIRGGGYINTVNKNDYKIFRAKLERAREILNKSKSFAYKDPYWYYLMFRIIKGGEFSPLLQDAVIQEAIKKHPYYYEIYFGAMHALTPRWGGSIDEMEKFARQAIQSSKAKEGTSMYVRTYWANRRIFKDQLFKKSKINWSMMSRSMDDVLARYPDQWNINNFAYFSCLARDKQKTAKLIRRISPRPIDVVWTHPTYSFGYCKKWALQ